MQGLCPALQRSCLWHIVSLCTLLLPRKTVCWVSELSSYNLHPTLGNGISLLCKTHLFNTLKAIFKRKKRFPWISCTLTVSTPGIQQMSDVEGEFNSSRSERVLEMGTAHSYPRAEHVPECIQLADCTLM